MTRPLPPQLASLAAQVRANPRLQAGLALIGLLLLGWLFLVLGDAREAQVKAVVEARQRYFQVRQLSGQEAWTQRAAEAVQLADALEAELPAAQSAGLAQATFQGWLKGITDTQGMPIRVDLQPPVRLDAPNEGVVRISANVAGSMDPRRVVDLVHRFESSTALVTIPEISVLSDGANQTFSMTVQGFYRVPAAEADAGAAP